MMLTQTQADVGVIPRHSNLLRKMLMQKDRPKKEVQLTKELTIHQIDQKIQEIK